MNKFLSAPPLRKSGFSLLELLCAIAVLAILVSILIPTLGSMKKRSNQIVCSNNLRSLGTAIHLYANEHSGRLPGPLYAGQYTYFPALDKYQLMAHIKEYIEINLIKGDRDRIKTMVCPAYESQIDSEGARHYILNVGRVPLTNGTKDQVFGYPGSDSTGREVNLPKRLNQIIEPNKSWAIKDLDQVDYPGYSSDTPEQPVHGESRNVLYFDGHIEAVPII